MIWKGGTSYRADIVYEYEVGYSSDLVCYGNWGSSDRSIARKKVRAHPTGSQVEVYYRPEDPEAAVIEREARGNAVFSYIFFDAF